MKPGESATQHLIDAAGHFIASSHANLSWQRVSVIVDGMLRRVRDPQAGGTGGDYREQVEKFEKDVEERVRQQFSYIPQMTVSVSFKVAMENTHIRSHSYDKDNVIHKPVEESERTSESSNPSAGPGGEPGAQPNIGMSITPAAVAQGPATTTENESKTKSQLLAGEQVKEVTTPPGMGTPLAAAVHIPRSYISSVIKEEKGGAGAGAAEPDEQAIQNRFKLEMDAIRKTVKAVVGLDNEQAVVVSMYTDLSPRPGAPGGGAGAGAGGFSTSVVAVAGAHSREILLGGLAVVSLFMVSMMVRKGNPLPALAAVAMPTMPMPVLDASETLAGEVSEGKQMLDAMELDEDAVRAQQMIDQVSSMVEENPDAAAGLVKRWLNRS
jgi:flagellar biosynthesis/type III secretory pathway M-ring protein FliF/YscJ